MRARRRFFTLALLVGRLPPGNVVEAQSPVPLPLRPSAIAFDAAGDVFFADSARNVVFEASLAGTLSIVAGTGVQGFAGDGGTATSALLNAPHGLAFTADGALFIADTGNHRVRAVRDGVISTVVGTGVAGFSGDGGPAVAAQLDRPWGLAFASDGALYIADSGNRRVRVLRGSSLSTFAGSGVQGSGGDGGAAPAAALNEPEGLALGVDGTLYIADAGNARVRSVSPAGVMATAVGTGIPGFAGEGGPATQARLLRPGGVAVGPAGELYIADSGNQRVREVAADGTLTTVAGAGMQGRALEGSAATEGSLDGPDAVAVSPFGRLWFTDVRNATLRAVSADARLFQPAGLVVRSSLVGGQTSAGAAGGTSLALSVAAPAGVPQGSIIVSEGRNVLATVALAGGSASLPLNALGGGTHTLTLKYSGDTLNPATTGTLLTSAGRTVLTATANSATVGFGDELPALTGSLEGVAPQDRNTVQVSFTTPASDASPVGTYPITATLTGPAASAYVLQVSSTSGQLTIAPQASTTALLTPLPAGYEGLPLSLTAVVASSARLKATGSVAFVENGVTLATAILVNGAATAVLPTPAVGTHAVIARYADDGNFLPSDTAPGVIAVNVLPDFTLTQTSTAVPTMDAGASAAFTLQVGASPAPFTGAVAFAMTGLPAGWTARFAPPNIIPGATGAPVTLTLTASTASLPSGHASGLLFSLLLLPCFLVFERRRISGRFASMAVVFAAAALSGCGDRVASTADVVLPHQATFTVTGTATNLAGRVVTHAVVVPYLQP